MDKLKIFYLEFIKAGLFPLKIHLKMTDFNECLVLNKKVIKIKSKPL